MDINVADPASDPFGPGPFCLDPDPSPRLHTVNGHIKNLQAIFEQNFLVVLILYLFIF
jgi:hypothetical protein